MENVDLYKLPKDILIKLFATFRQDVEKILEDKYAKQISKLQLKKDMLDEINMDLDDRGIFYNTEFCNHKGCKNYMMENDAGIFYRTADIYHCQACMEVWYCNDHVHEYLNEDMECNNCTIHIQQPQEPEQPPRELEEVNETDDDVPDLINAEENEPQQYKSLAVLPLHNLPNMFYSID